MKLHKMRFKSLAEEYGGYLGASDLRECSSCHNLTLANEKCSFSQRTKHREESKSDSEFHCTFRKKSGDCRLGSVCPRKKSPLNTAALEDETQDSDTESAQILIEDSGSLIEKPPPAIKDCPIEVALRKKNRKHRASHRFHKEQAKLLEAFERDRKSVQNRETNIIQKGIRQQRDRRMAILSFGINLILFIAKIVAAALSGSLSVISSVVDSGADLTSGIVVWVTGKAVEKWNPHRYPRGRAPLEPLSQVAISIIMGFASIQMIFKTVEVMIKREMQPEVGIPTICIIVGTIILKFGLMIMCRCKYNRSPMTTVLAQDHRNDCISNLVALLCGFFGDRYWVWIDPIGAIIVSLYILGTWCRTGWQQIGVIAGRAAPADIIKRTIAVCLDLKHPGILEVGPVLAYAHGGSCYAIEVSLNVDDRLSICEATSKIVKPLKQRLEALPFVSHAYVHLNKYVDV